jgi:hypothetical protein
MLSSPALQRLRRHRSLAGFVVLGMLCRAMIPAGFMPAPIGAGGPVAICHAGLAGELFRRLDAARDAAATASLPGDVDPGHGSHRNDRPHGGHDLAHDGQAGQTASDGDSPAAGHEAWEHCPFGAAPGAALLTADVVPELPALAHSLEAIEPSLPVPFRPVVSYRARAPPSAAIYS